MTGNVWEWVADEFADYPSGSKENTVPDPPTATHILRGGSWGYPPAFSRTAYRYIVPPDANYQAVGFRCMVPID